MRPTARAAGVVAGVLLLGCNLVLDNFERRLDDADFDASDRRDAKVAVPSPTLDAEVVGPPDSGDAGDAETLPPCDDEALGCRPAPATGATTCRSASGSTLHCCPAGRPLVVDGGCAAVVCGSGLACTTTPTQGAMPCRQTPTSTSEVHCCPEGWTIASNACVPPECGTGLNCSAGAIIGASRCRQPSTANVVYCCPAGQSNMAGSCQ